MVGSTNGSVIGIGVGIVVEIVVVGIVVDIVVVAIIGVDFAVTVGIVVDIVVGMVVGIVVVDIAVGIIDRHEPAKNQKRPGQQAIPVALLFQPNVQAGSRCRIQTIGEVRAVGGKERPQIRFVSQRDIDVKVPEGTDNDSQYAHRDDRPEASHRHRHNGFSVHEIHLPFKQTDRFHCPILALFFLDCGKSNHRQDHCAGDHQVESNAAAVMCYCRIIGIIQHGNMVSSSLR